MPDTFTLTRPLQGWLSRFNARLNCKVINRQAERATHAFIALPDGHRHRIVRAAMVQDGYAIAYTLEVKPS